MHHHGQETETEVVLPHLQVFWLSKNNFIGHTGTVILKEEVDRRGGKTILRSALVSHLIQEILHLASILSVCLILSGDHFSEL